MKYAEDNSLYVLFLHVVLNINIVDEMEKELTIFH